MTMIFFLCNQTKRGEVCEPVPENVKKKACWAGLGHRNKVHKDGAKCGLAVKVLLVP